MKRGTKARILVYSIWLAWGASTIAFVWTDAIPYGGWLIFAAWCAGFIWATWFTGGLVSPTVVNPSTPNSNGPSESN
jgi:hypothetical protein